MLQQPYARAASFAAAAGLLTLSACATATAPAATAAACDRECLGALVTQYIDAVVAHDASGLPLAADARFTENSVDMEIGAGTWATITGAQGFRQDYLDTTAQVAASHFVLNEGVNTILYTVLLHVEDGEIGGVETLVQRITPESRFQPTMLGQPLYAMNDPVPTDQKLSREDAIKTALTYTEGLRVGTFVDIAPFSDQAYRIENGSFMAGYGCPRAECPDIQTQDIIEHPDVDASVAAVDEENGAVLLWMNFGDTNSYGEGNALVTFEAFKVWGDEIHVVHAFFPILKKETERGWPSTDPVPEWRTN